VGLERAACRLAPLLLVVAAALTVAKVLLAGGPFGFDFQGTVWQASRDVLHGRSPYPAADVHALLLKHNPAVYPPAILFFASPLELLPLTLATVVWDVFMAGCLAAALWLVGVRDRRIYAVVFVSFPFASSMALGQIDALLALGCALSWRYREHAARAALAVAATVATKVFLWPLAIWLLVTGRRKAAAVSALGTVVLLVVAWAGIGFAGFAQYPHLLAANARAFAAGGYSPVATAVRLGLPLDLALVAAPLAAALLLLVTARTADAVSDRQLFAAAVACGVLALPIVWVHSLLILFVAFAVVRPRFSGAWLLPLALYVSGTGTPHWHELLACQLTIVLIVALALRPAPGLVQRSRGAGVAPLRVHPGEA
jgi:hypothetical protein